MTQAFLQVLLLCFFSQLTFGADSSAPFRLSLSDLPKTLDPHRLRSSSGQFLSQQLYRNFFSYSPDNSYVSELGEKCEKKKLKWVCTIRKEAQWSNGQPITAEDFVLSYQRILTLPSPRADLLFSIKNAREVLAAKMKPESLGVKALSEKTFEIEWLENSPDQDVILMSPLFVPLPRGQFQKRIWSGPYQLTAETNQKVSLNKNPFYLKKNNRPPLEFIVFEENLSVKAYEKGQLDFLRRVPTAQIPKAQNEKDFYWQSVLRMDSIGFGPELQKNPELRRALTESLDFAQIQALFHSPKAFGCFGLPDDLASEICFQGSGSLKLQAKPSLTFSFSTAGGDDHRRLSEWIQSQWLQKLKLKVKLQPLENKIFQETLEKKGFQIYRRGLNLESPSCYNALEIFTTNHPENSSSLSHSEFDSVVKKLKTTAKPDEQKKLCEEGLRILKNQYAMIPTGRIHFAFRVKPQWKGWKINRLFHLDLSELELR